jgi:hypothetical protein
VVQLTMGGHCFEGEPHYAERKGGLLRGCDHFGSRDAHDRMAAVRRRCDAPVYPRRMNCRGTDAVILGAGLQGAGVALELARRGIRVTLIDQDFRPLNRASLRNEGKIHFGFVYANDRSLRTAFLQLEGALRFRGILARWIGRGDEWLVSSAHFYLPGRA